MPPSIHAQKQLVMTGKTEGRKGHEYTSGPQLRLDPRAEGSGGNEIPLHPAIAGKLPQPDPRQSGRPNNYPDHVYVLLLVIRGVLGAQRPAVSWMAVHWKEIRKWAGAEWGVKLRKRPPRRNACQYNMRRLRAHHKLILDEFHRLALEQAQRQGCLLQGLATQTRPERRNTVVGDGTVPRMRLKQSTYDRLKKDGKLRHEVGVYYEAGNHRISGFKQVLFAVRPDGHPNSRLIIRIASVPAEGRGGEAGIAADEAIRLRMECPGFLGFRYDGAFRGVHIDLLEKAGIDVISPLAKDDRRHPYGHVTCSNGHTHSLYTEGGDFVELEALDTGELRSLPCFRLRQYARKNSTGTYRWYVSLRLSCGAAHLERLDKTKEDDSKHFNRTQRVRQHPPASAEYQNTYGWREDIESVNNNLDTTLYRHRMIVDTPEDQTLVIIGFAIARNAMSAAVFSARLAAGLIRIHRAA